MSTYNSINLKPIGIIAKNNNTYCAAVCRRKPLLLSLWPGVLFLVKFNHFDQTVGF